MGTVLIGRAQCSQELIHTFKKCVCEKEICSETSISYHFQIWRSLVVLANPTTTSSSFWSLGLQVQANRVFYTNSSKVVLKKIQVILSVWNLDQKLSQLVAKQSSFKYGIPPVKSVFAQLQEAIIEEQLELCWSMI